PPIPPDTRSPRFELPPLPRLTAPCHSGLRRPGERLPGLTQHPLTLDHAELKSVSKPRLEPLWPLEWPRLSSPWPIAAPPHARAPCPPPLRPLARPRHGPVRPPEAPRPRCLWH